MSAPQEFKTVAELLAAPERWTKGWFARRDDNLVGGWVLPNDPRAACWCLSGAVERVYPSGGAQADACCKLYRVLEELGDRADPANGFDLSAWNDAASRTHAEVLELVTKAGI